MKLRAENRKTDGSSTAPFWSTWHIRSRTAGSIVAVAVLILSPVASVSAQQAKLDISGGYGFLNGGDLWNGYGLGWIAAGEWGASRWLSLVVEASRYQSRQDIGFIDVEHTVGNLVTGPRLWLKRPRVSPFAHVLAGVTQVGVVADTSGPVESAGADTVLSGMLQIGGGIELPLSNVLDLRIGIDYPRILVDHLSDQSRFWTGLVYRIGGL